MPNRILREGILTSPRIAKLGWPEETFYRRMMSVVDDFGRYYADYGLLRAACYPRQLNKVSDSDIGKWLQVIADAALVRVYPASDGESYLQLLDFRQQARAAKSKFPQPPIECAADAMQVQSNGEASAHLGVSVDEVVEESSSPASPSTAAPPSLSAVPAAIPDCPHRELIALFVAAVPELPKPRVEMWSGKNADAMRARWLWVLTAKRESGQRYATSNAEGVSWFERFFQTVAASDFLTGRNGKFSACHLGWLMNKDNFAKVVQGNYENRRAA